MKTINLTFNKKLRRFNFCSAYNYNFYKLFLINKLFLSSKKSLNAFFIKKIKSKNLIYNRHEKFPFRLFRYYSLFPFDLKNNNILDLPFLINTKIKVYSGRKFKPINIYRV